MAKKKVSKKSNKEQIEELKTLLFAESRGVDSVGLLTEAKRVFTGDVHQRNIGRVAKIIEEL